MLIKSVKTRNWKNKKKCVSFSSPKDQSTQKVQKVCSVARKHTDTQTHMKVNIEEDTLSGFQELFLLPIIKDQSNYQFDKQW